MSEEPGHAPLVVIHGLIHACAHLRRGARPGARAILVPDLPGYGSNDPDSPTSIERAVDFLEAWWLDLGLEGAHVAGHSLGGAIAMVFADRFPERVRSIVDIEGNFTLVDAFWSKGIAEGPLEDAAAWLSGFRRDVRGWLLAQGIDPAPDTLAWAAASLDAQSALPMRTMARSVVDVTSAPGYLELVARVVRRGLPVHLVAGAHSVGGWDVPGFVRDGAASSVVLPGVGHMMMLEDPDALVAAVERAVACSPPAPGGAFGLASTLHPEPSP
jgi:lipase